MADWGLILFQLACVSFRGSSAPANSGPIREITGQPEPSIVASPTAPQQNGIACVSFGNAYWTLVPKDKGVACLSASGWRYYTSANSSLMDADNIFLRSCNDKILARNLKYHFMDLVDGQWSMISLPDKMQITRASCDGSGGYWAMGADSNNIYHISSSGSIETLDIGFSRSSEDRVFNITVGLDGSLWAVTYNKVLHCQNNQWATYNVTSGYENQLLGILAGSDKSAFTFTSNALFAWNGQQWTSMEIPVPNPALEELFFDSKGRLLAYFLMRGCIGMTREAGL